MLDVVLLPDGSESSCGSLGGVRQTSLSILMPDGIYSSCGSSLGGWRRLSLGYNIQTMWWCV